MQRKTGWIVAGTVVAATIAGATGIATASGSGGTEGHPPITGSAYDKATSVALRTTGGGTVTETEKGDEESYYQVEVTASDGRVTDVNLDKAFSVVKTKTEAADTGSESG
jgi:hypothetical protein